MQRYIVLYLAPAGVAERFARATPEEAQQGMKLWGVWADKIGTALVDPGKPLGNAMLVTKTGITQTDSKIIGMSILQANTMDEALDMVKNHHHLHWADHDPQLLDWADKCEILVLEEVPIPELQA